MCCVDYFGCVYFFGWFAVLFFNLIIIILFFVVVGSLRGRPGGRTRKKQKLVLVSNLLRKRVNVVTIFHVEVRRCRS